MKSANKIYLYIGCACLALLTLSVPVVHKFQGAFFSLLHWRAETGVQRQEELEDLQLENALLHAKLEAAKQAAKHLAQLPASEGKEMPLEFQERLDELLTLQTNSIPAAVLSRAPRTWNSRLWVGVGNKHSPHIQKNSPVVFGNRLVGVIDEVQKKKSLVRLITDPKLYIAVRAKRDDSLLAKGELHGSQKTHWRKRGVTLTGEGFNYDFSDCYGPARELHNPKDPLLQVGDTLITSGLDSLFPEGLEVAEVTEIEILREGDTCYNLTAQPLLPNLDEMRLLFILPARESYE